MDSLLFAIPYNLFHTLSHFPQRFDSIVRITFQKGIIEACKDEDLNRRIKGIAWQVLGSVYLISSTYAFFATIIAGTGGIAGLSCVAFSILGLILGYDLIKMGDNLFDDRIYKTYSELVKTSYETFTLDESEACLIHNKELTTLDRQIIYYSRRILLLSEKTLLINDLSRLIRNFLVTNSDCLNKVKIYILSKVNSNS